MYFVFRVATRPSSQEPIIGCTGTVTSQAQVDSVRDCTVLNGAIDFHNSTITMINLPLLEQITGKVFLEGNDSFDKPFTTRFDFHRRTLQSQI